MAANPFTNQDYSNPWAPGFGGAPAAAAPKAEEWPGQNSGYPKPPEYKSSLDGGGNLLDQYKLKAQPSIMGELNGKLGQSQGFIDQLSKYAGGATGSSPWAQAQLADLGNQTNQAYGQVGNQVNAGVAAGSDAAASRGGLTSAMRGNLARNAMNQTVNAKQGVAGNALNARNQIFTNDANQQLGVMKALPGMQNENTNIWSNAAQGDQRYNTLVDQENIKNSLGGLSGQNTFNMEKYGDDIKRQAGMEQANAIAHSGKK